MVACESNRFSESVESDGGPHLLSADHSTNRIPDAPSFRSILTTIIIIIYVVAVIRGLDHQLIPSDGNVCSVSSLSITADRFAILQCTPSGNLFGETEL